MKNIEIIRGKIYKSVKNNNRYRLLNIINDEFILSVMDTSRFDLLYMKYDDVMFLVLNKDWVEIPEETLVYDLSVMSKASYDKYVMYCRIFQSIVDEYGPDYKGLLGHRCKEFLKNICADYGISRRVLWKFINRYFQSGFDFSVFVDKRYFAKPKSGCCISSVKRGRKSELFGDGYNLTEADLSNFNEAIKFFRNGQFKTKKAAFDFLNNKFYRNEEDGRLKHLSQRPTFRQFKYYFDKCVSRSDVTLIKSSRREYDNNNRILYGNRLFNARCPGWSAQIDACEVPFSLVSKYNPHFCVANPTVYFMVDTYTGAITAVSVAYTQNSNLGFTNLFLNLADDKAEFCKKYGVKIENIDKIWPSGYIPRHIYLDRGAECTSNEVTRICQELGIEKHLVPGAMGSAKGLVERAFGQMLTKQIPYWEKIGYISDRHDSEHHKESVMDIDVYTRCVINFVIEHNQRYMTGFPMVKELEDNNVPVIPCEIWQYGVEHIDSPRYINNLSSYCYTLMLTKPLRLSRKGINYKSLYYVNDDPVLLKAMADAGDNRVPFDVRMDPRDVSAVYYVRNNTIYCARVSEKRPDGLAFVGMTLQMYDEYFDKRKKKDMLYRQHNEELDANNAGFALGVVQEMKHKAVPKVTTKVVKIREARHNENALVSVSNKIADRINKSDSGLKLAQEKLLPDNSARAVEEEPVVVERDSDIEDKEEEIDVNDFDVLSEYFHY